MGSSFGKRATPEAGEELGGAAHEEAGAAQPLDVPGHLLAAEGGDDVSGDDAGTEEEETEPSAGPASPRRS
jgi:hypothetical protein